MYVQTMRNMKKKKKQKDTEGVFLADTHTHQL